VPVDAKLKTDMDVAFEAISMDLILQAIEPAKSLKVIILDACRDNPFRDRMMMTQGGTRGISRGLAQINPPGETLVAYAAKAGFVAEDGYGNHSPFTTALLQHLPTPGLDIRLMFGRVRDTVMEITNRRQEPYVYGSVGGREVYLRAAEGGAAVAAATPTAPAVSPSAPARPSPEPDMSRPFRLQAGSAGAGPSPPPPPTRVPPRPPPPGRGPPTRVPPRRA